MEDDRPRILALCAGYGGLETAIRAGIGGQVAAFAENDPYAAAVFAAHHPQVPNLGDITAVDWHTVRDLYRPDVVGAGFPCRNISNAGRRDGIHGRWSRVWKNVAQAVGVLRPRLVFLENVAALRSRGLDTVAADLATLGYDVRWTCLRAGDPEIGAPHPRDRWFAVAHPSVQDPHLTARGQRRPAAPGETETGRTRADAGGRSGLPAPAVAGGLSLFPTPTAADSRGTANFRADGTPYGNGYGSTPTDAVRSLLPTPAARDWKSGASNLLGRNARPLNEVVVNLLPGQAVRLDDRWVATDGTDYGPAIRRWEHVTGRPAPCPTEPGTRGNRRLSPVFTEWLMGLPAGWVTDVPDIPRKEQLKILGNGVVPQQAHHAYGLLLDNENWKKEEDDSMAEPPKYPCSGCEFSYTLTRDGMIRKHKSRTGPGLCEGAGKVQRDPETAEPLPQLDAAPPVFAEPLAPPVPAAAPDVFAAPLPASDIPEKTLTVSGQPQPDRDRWGRYMILGQPHTRATTFAKSIASTFSLNQWSQRMVVKGLAQRPDLLAMAHGLHERHDKGTLDSIAEQAKTTAGDKIAANLGTAYHSFSERIEAGLMQLSDVPQQYRPRVAQYLAEVERYGLTTRPEWIERTTAVRADQVSAVFPVAGTFDRVFRLPSGELVIGDLKTGRDLSYAWHEIEVQLALYAHGVNTHGVFDWNTKSWEDHNADSAPGITRLRVRTDIAIVMHLPAEGNGCTLHRVDIESGWRRAQLCGQVMADQRAKPSAPQLTAADLAPRERPELTQARKLFAEAPTRERIAELYQYALDSGRFSNEEMGRLAADGTARLKRL